MKYELFTGAINGVWMLRSFQGDVWECLAIELTDERICGGHRTQFFITSESDYVPEWNYYYELHDTDMEEIPQLTMEKDTGDDCTFTAQGVVNESNFALEDSPTSETVLHPEANKYFTQEWIARVEEDQKTLVKGSWT